MSNLWDPKQYLRFRDQRGRPCLDLIRQIEIDSPDSIMDLGCGPGNSTAALRTHWPQAMVTGLDGSREMLAEAQRDHPQWRWIERDIQTFADQAEDFYDLVFSNAALHWLGDHAQLFPKLIQRVKTGGALAVQMPVARDHPAQQALQEAAATPAWSKYFRQPVRKHWRSQLPQEYYAILASCSPRMDIWQTTYFHLLNGLDDIVEWYRGSALRPYLAALPDESARQDFIAAYRLHLAKAYPPQPDGRLLFPFPRIFIIAYRGG